jgi:HK97 family phage portal protein
VIGWLKRRFKNATLKEPEWWRQAMNAKPVTSGVPVNEDTAMQVSAVYACVRILAETIASLPVRVYERNGDSKRVATSHPLDTVLHTTPNAEQTAYELRELQMVHLGLRGTSYNQILRSRMGRIGEIYPLFTQYMNVDRGADGRLIFDYQEPGAARVFSQDEIWRTAGLGSNGVTGLAPISLARESIGLAIATEMHGAKLFSNGAQIPGVLEYPQALSDKAYERLKKEFESRHSGVGNASRTLILEGGMKYQTVGMTSEDSQFIESRKFQISEIARWYRVPLHMLNELDRATFSNIEQQSIEFVVHTIRPWLVRIEQSINRDLLTSQERKRYFVEHNVEGLLRGDTTSRYSAYSQAIQDGWMSRNEVRRLENLDPADGLDDFLVPLNMSPQNAIAASVAQDLINTEIRAISAENSKKTKDEMRDWLPKFYERHLNKAGDMMGISPESLADYAVNHMKEVINSENLTATLEGWRNNARDELMGYIK